MKKGCGRIKAIVFDVDGVLVPIKSSWGYIHEKLGTVDVSERNYRLFLEGKIGYWEWMYLDILAWIEAFPGLTRWDLEEIVNDIEPLPEAYDVVKCLKKKGYKVGLLSAGVEIVVAKVARLLGTEYWMAPLLEFDSEGRLVPGGYPLVEAGKKHIALARLVKRMGVSLAETAFVGDTVWDLSAMKEACIGIAVGNVEEAVKREADIHIQSLSELVEVFGLRC